MAAAITALAVWVVPGIVVSSLTPYSMSADMERIADRIGFTDEGMDLFAQARPQLMASTEFLRACADPSDPAEDEEWSSIGCFDEYVFDHGRIAVFDPANERLVDQTIVTTAHEFLHAAYAQISYEERSTLNKLLADRWAQVPADDLIQEELASSVGSWKANRPTEQFAYLGTEIAEEFDPELEAFYSRYFEDRSAVVAAYAADQALWNGMNDDLQVRSDALTALEDANAATEAQLKVDRAQRDADRAGYVSAVTEFAALSQVDQDRSYVAGEDGDPDELYEDYLASYSAELDQRDAELETRQQALDAAFAEEDLAWADLEPRYDEFDELADASFPSVE